MGIVFLLCSVSLRLRSRIESDDIVVQYFVFNVIAFYVFFHVFVLKYMHNALKCIPMIGTFELELN